MLVTIVLKVDALLEEAFPFLLIAKFDPNFTINKRKRKRERTGEGRETKGERGEVKMEEGERYKERKGRGIKGWHEYKQSRIQDNPVVDGWARAVM